MKEGNVKPFEFENKNYYVNVTDKNYQVVSKVTNHVEHETTVLPEAMKVCTELDQGMDYFDNETYKKLKGEESTIVVPSKEIIM